MIKALLCKLNSQQGDLADWINGNGGTRRRGLPPVLLTP